MSLSDIRSLLIDKRCAKYIKHRDSLCPLGRPWGAYVYLPILIEGRSYSVWIDPEGADGPISLAYEVADGRCEVVATGRRLAVTKGIILNVQTDNLDYPFSLDPTDAEIIKDAMYVDWNGEPVLLMDPESLDRFSYLYNHLTDYFRLLEGDIRKEEGLNFLDWSSL